MGQYTWSVKCSANVNNNYSATQSAVTVYAIWHNDGWYYDIYINAWVTCNGSRVQIIDWQNFKTTGAGAYDDVVAGSYTFLVNKTENARNIACKAEIQASSYAGGTTKEGNYTATVGALPKYTISFDANGGSGAPASIQKVHGVEATLPSAIPTRYGYEFLGWATSATAQPSYSAGGKINVNANTKLYAVWKVLASQGETKTFTIGNTVNLSWTKYVSAYRHTIKYKFGEASGTIASNVDTSCSWTIPMNLCNQLPNATQGEGTWTIETYEGSTLIGSLSYKLTLNVPASVVPTFSCTLSNDNRYFTAYSTIHSKLVADFTCNGAYGSTVQTANVRYDDIDYSEAVENGSASVSTNELNIAGTRTVILTILDSRGRVAIDTRTITVYEYNAPRIDSLDVDVYGNVATINVAGVIAPINNQNSKFITIKKVRTSDQQETTVVARTALDAYTFNKTYQQTIADIGTETYLFKVTIEDKVTSALAQHESGITAISLYAGGKGITLFGEAQEEGIEYYTDEGDIAQLSMTTDQWQEIYDLLGITED